MTKRKIVDDTANELPEDDQAEVEAGHLGDVPDAPNEAELEHDARTSDAQTAPMVLSHKAGGTAVIIDVEDIKAQHNKETFEGEELIRVSLALPRSALVALLDRTNPLSDSVKAVALQLLDWDPDTNVKFHLSNIGLLVRHGFDETAVRHKMNAAYRNAVNANVDNGV